MEAAFSRAFESLAGTEDLERAYAAYKRCAAIVPAASDSLKPLKRKRPFGQRRQPVTEHLFIASDDLPLILNSRLIDESIFQDTCILSARVHFVGLVSSEPEGYTCWCG